MEEELNLDTEVTTTASVSFEQLEPYFIDIHSNLSASNGLLLFLIIYLVVKDIGKLIYSFLYGGIN